jgi:hypothetical protein
MHTVPHDLFIPHSLLTIHVGSRVDPAEGKRFEGRVEGRRKTTRLQPLCDVPDARRGSLRSRLFTPFRCNK